MVQKKLFWGVYKSLLNINETCLLESFFSRSSHSFFVSRVVEVDGTFKHDGFSRLFACSYKKTNGSAIQTAYKTAYKTAASPAV